MSNKLRGEMTLSIDGVDYKLKMNTNQLCVAESLLGETAAVFAPKIIRGDMTTLRAVFWAAVQKYQPNLTPVDVGELIDELSPMLAQEKMQELMSLAFPPPESAEEAAERPTKPAKASPAE